MTRIADDFAAIRGSARLPVAAGDDPVQRLARLWEVAQQKGNDAPDEPTSVQAFEELNAVETEVFALPQCSLARVVLKLRVLASWLANDKGDWDHGVRTGPLNYDERMLASALADMERLAGSRTTHGEG
jgi:hypothetical protein